MHAHHPPITPSLRPARDAASPRGHRPRLSLTLLALATAALAATAPTATLAASEAAETTPTRWIDTRQPGPAAHAPTAHQPGAPHAPMFDPVDEAVGDLDTLSRSLRLVEPGHARFPEHARVHRLHPDAPGLWSRLGQPGLDQHHRHRHTYRYQAPGVRAWLRQPEYLVRGNASAAQTPFAINQAPRHDREHLPLIPADTVFDLTPRPTAPTPGPTPSQEHTPARQGDDQRLAPHTDMRLDTRIDTRIDTSLND